MNNNQEVLYKEIDLIQSCIKRMAQNSFMVKGWLITILAVVFALLPERVNLRFLCLLSFIIILCFWYLDGFFLKAERLYRWKYEWVISQRLNSTEYVFDLNPYNKNMWLPKENNKERTEPSIICVMFSKTLRPLYCPLLALVIFLFINSYYGWIDVL